MDIEYNNIKNDCDNSFNNSITLVFDINNEADNCIFNIDDQGNKLDRILQKQNKIDQDIDNIDKNIQKIGCFGCFGCFSYLKTKKHIKHIKPIKTQKIDQDQHNECNYKQNSATNSQIDQIFMNKINIINNGINELREKAIIISEKLDIHNNKIDTIIENNNINKTNINKTTINASKYL